MKDAADKHEFYGKYFINETRKYRFAFEEDASERRVRLVVQVAAEIHITEGLVELL